VLNGESVETAPAFADHRRITDPLMGRAKAAQPGRFAYYAYRGGYVVLNLLPRRVALIAAAGLGRLGSRVMPTARATVASNLRQVLTFTDATVDEAKLDDLVSAAFASYGRYWADVASLSPEDARRMDDHYHVTGREHVDEALRNGGVIFALPHVGSWEIGGVWADREGFPFLTVAEDAANSRLTDWFIGRRERLGMRVLRLAPDTSVKLLAELRSGGAIALVADRDVVGDGIVLPFFGVPTRIPPGPAVLSLRTGATIIPCVVYQDGANYEAHFGPLIVPDRQGTLRADVERITAELIAVFEHFIAAHPEQWHAFQPLWSHGSETPQAVADQP
jgi:phosphatidylinositol dimannoside acyltransferase